MKKVQILFFSLFVLVGTVSLADYSEAANSWVCSNASCSIRGTSCPTAGQTTACPSPTGSSCTCQTLSPNATWSVSGASAGYSCSSSKACPSGPCNTSTDSSYACGSCTGGNYSSFAQCGSGGGGGGGGGCGGSGYVPSCYGQCKTPPNGGTYSSMPATSSLCSVGNPVNIGSTSTTWNWSCKSTMSGGTTQVCSAYKTVTSITCGSANGGTFSSSGPSSSALCSDGSKPTVSPHYTGSYWTGWSWTCGTNSCSANLSPGVCGSANGTTRSSAPSTAAELCQAGSPSSVSGSGPWTWSCTGTSCSASKTVPSCTPSCPNPSSYCTTDYLGSDGCGGSCGYGSVSCSKLKVCPTSITLNPLETYNLTAKYWSSWSSTSLPTCTSGLWADKTPSATWSRSSGLATTAVVGNGDANGAKGLVTAGSPSVNSSITAKAVYSNRQAFGGVTVMPVSSGPSGVINATPCTIPLNGSSCTSTVSWSSSNFSGSTSVRQNGTSFSSSGSNAGTSRSVSFSNNTFTLVDTGSAFTASATASVSCASGVWDGSKCAAAICLCDPSEDASQCVGGYTNSCGASCTGTKDCSQPWVEVRP